VPVVDIEKLLGLENTHDTGTERYLVLRVAKPMDNTRKIVHCILRVSDKISVIDVPDSCSAIDPDSIELVPLLLRGAFECEDAFLLIPDILSVLPNCDII